MGLAAHLLDDLDDDDLARLAERLRPYLSADADRLLTPAEAAGRLGVHVKTLGRATRDGRVPGAVRVGGQWRYDARGLALLPPARREAEPPPAPRPLRSPATRKPTTADAIRRAA
jgi:excisionase family DNA binding protein